MKQKNVDRLLKIIEDEIMTKIPYYGHGAFGEPEITHDFRSGEELFLAIKSRIELEVKINGKGV